MMEKLTLIKLDEIVLQQHIDLESTDHCRYWRVYTANEKFSFSETNQLIKNFKISPQEKHRLHYKKTAIEQIAQELMQVIPSHLIYQNYTFIPVPPSKPIGHPEYDDRLVQVLKRVQQEKRDLDFRLLVEQLQPISAAHTVPPEQRPNIQELYQLYAFNSPLKLPIPKKIVIFDDVLTKGTHFKAMQKVLIHQYPNVPVVGLFIALSVYKQN